ncbi:MAG: quinone-dependent dihydroorotate dehydrogenase [Hyphomicrobiaceae bacterium]|nr:MAG: quinone-dependent dihydroorotate dehydrogenase [Hyphomicrobiaceae bacterium]
MLPDPYLLARSVLFRLEPEKAHELTLKSLQSGLYPRPGKADDPRLAQRLLDLEFPNPIGIAAGFDKDARVPDAVLGLGCGFAEIGSVTPLPQPGNAAPRVFRLLRDEALINRLGFNNAGHAVALRRLTQRQQKGIVGVNVGANKDAADRAADYVSGVEAFYPFASYFTINISSPNTPGLRDLQAPKALDDLLGRVMAKRAELEAKGAGRRPILVKLSPDAAAEDLPAIVERLVAHAVDGIAVSNTTLSRAGLVETGLAKETGGLSGKPLFRRSTIILARVFKLTHGKVPLIGIGGIHSGEAALAKIEAGASLLQLYTGLVYRGPALLGEIKADLLAAVEKSGKRSIAELTGRGAGEWASRSIDEGSGPT